LLRHTRKTVLDCLTVAVATVELYVLLKMKLAILSLLFSAITLSADTENTIHLHNGELETSSSSEWAIIAHRPAGDRTVVAFQLFENKAEEGTDDSTNLSIATFYLKDTESMMAFVQPLTKKAEEGEKDSEYGGWAIRDWSGKQGEVEYRISDARLTHDRLSIGIHVRLAWPLLDANPKGYEDRMKKVLQELLDGITKRNPTKAEEDGADQPATTPQSKPEGKEKIKPESEGRSQ